MIADYFVCSASKAERAPRFTRPKASTVTPTASAWSPDRACRGGAADLPGFLVTVKLSMRDAVPALSSLGSTTTPGLSALGLRSSLYLDRCGELCPNSHSMKTPRLSALRPSARSPTPARPPTRSSRCASEFLNPGIFLYYKKPLMLVEGQDAVCLRRNTAGATSTARRDRDHERGPLPSRTWSRRRSAQNELLQHSTTIYLHPNIARYAADARGENAGRPEGLLFRQFRLRSQRSRASDGAGLHGQLRHDCTAQCLSRRKRCRHGTNGASHLEI